MKKILLVLVALGLVCMVGFLLLQVMPYGRFHTNPAVVREPAWDSPRTRELAKRACFDCHSNETVWPWYSNFAPVSWLVQRDVEEGRRRLNFSEWGSRRDEGKAAEAVRKGEMPESKYLITHPEARLTAQEKQELISGLQATTRQK